MDENKVNFNPAVLNQQAIAEEAAHEKQLSIVDIINMMLTFWWLIVLLAIVIGGGAYAAKKLTSVPQYNSSGTLYIDTQQETNSDDVNTSGIKAAASLLTTYIKVLESTPFLDDVCNNINNKYSTSEVKRMITYQAVEGTNLIVVKVKTTDSHDAYIVAKSVLRSAPQKIAQVFEGGSVKMIEYPKESTSPEADNAFRTGIIGFIIGAGIAMIIIFLINLFDTRVKNTEELTTRYKMPILGEIPNLMEM